MKLKEFQDILKKRKIDFALFFNLNPIEADHNLFYFSGYSGIGVLVIGQKKAFLLVPKMEYEKARKSRIRKVYALDKKKLFDSVLEKIKKNKIKRKKIGIDKSVVTLTEYSAFKKSFKKCKIANVSRICYELRETKTKEEIRIIKKACQITDKILTKCFKNFRRFKYETDVVVFLEQETRRSGCSFSFPPIVASGVSSSQPHYEPKPVRLKKGFCVIDFGIRYNGYCSDMTRTIYLGKPSRKEKEFYYLLLNVQTATIKKIEEERKTSKVVQFVKNNLGRYDKNFIHGLGHGIGVELHELPNLKETDKSRLKENNIFTIEPGIYFPGKFGIRIEDDVLLGKNVEVLTKVTKDLIIVN
jgi:Xaa-Pro aminopeptidase